MPKVASRKLKDVGEKPHYTYCDCPFCGKQGIRKDNYPVHLKAELKNLAATAPADLVEILNGDDEGTQDFSHISGCDVVFREIQKENGDTFYSSGVCLECHRHVDNKNAHTTEAYVNHDCGHRKRKPDVIEHVSAEAPITQKESNILRNLRNAVLHNVERHHSLTPADKSALKEYFKDCRNTEKTEEGMADEIDGMVSAILRYQCRVIRDLRESGNTDEMDAKFLKEFPDIIEASEPVMDQVRKYLRAWRKYRAEAADISIRVAEEVMKATEEVEADNSRLTQKSGTLMREIENYEIALSGLTSQNKYLEEQVKILQYQNSLLQNKLVEAPVAKKPNGFKVVS
jgi:hypothetical protein